jgi:uncharacterized membrane protein
MHKYPKHWRKIVVKSLADQGLAVTSQQVADVRRGKITNPEITIPVLAAMAKVRRDHARNQKRMIALQTAATVFFVIIWVL